MWCCYGPGWIDSESPISWCQIGGERPHCGLSILYDDLRVGVAGGEGVHPGEAELAGAVGAMRGSLLTLDDRKGGVHVAHVVAASDAVEVEENRIQLRAQEQAPVFVPHERRQ